MRGNRLVSCGAEGCGVLCLRAAAAHSQHVSRSSSDTRLGARAQTVAMDFQKVFKVNDRVYVGLAGLATDVLTV